MSDFGSFYSDLNINQMSLKLVRRHMGEATPVEVRGWERAAVDAIERFNGTWTTYPMSVDGVYATCTPAEATFLRRHHLAMTRLYAVVALQQVTGEGEMTKDEFIKRLQDLRVEFTWLNGNVPPRLTMHLAGGYTRNLDYVKGELEQLEA